MRHHLQTEPVDMAFIHGKADQPAAELGHEIDRLRRGHLRRDDKVALVLAVLVVDQDEHAPVAGLADDFLDRGQFKRILLFSRCVHQAASLPRMRAA